MTATGWVRIWRSIRECRLALRGSAWELLMIHLVMDAEWQGPARGTLTVSVRDYARREGLEREKLRWMLDEMAADGFIALETVGGVTRHRRTLVRILKYADYQGDITEPDDGNTQCATQSNPQFNPQTELCGSTTYDDVTPNQTPNAAPRTPPNPLTTTEEEFKKEHTQNAPAHVREEPPPSGWLPSGAPPGLEAYPTRPEEVTAAAELLGFRMESSEGLQFLLFWQERDWTLSDGSKVRSWRTSLHRWLSHPRRDYLNGRHDGQSRENQRIWSEDRRKRVGGIGADYYSGSDVEWLRRQGLLPGGGGCPSPSGGGVVP